MTTSFAVWRREGFIITTDPAATDLDAVCGFLATSYWARDVPRADLEASIRAARVYNLLEEAERRQIGFARVVTDGVRFAWLSDVFVLDAWRGRGLARWLVATIMADPTLREVRRWLLATLDAQGLYRACGWAEAPAGRLMEYRPAPTR